MRPGDRVVTYEQQASATEVDPETWRKITLRLPNPDCPEDVVDLQLLRSPEWMELVGCAEGAQIWFDLDEMAIHGPALVTAVEACPPLAPGTGRVVLATVTHFNTCVLDVRLVGQAETLSPTSNHPLYSATRHDWVRAGSLIAGEELVTREGIVTVESITPRSGAYRVYNLEVEGEHAYYAGAAQVLSHNNCANAAESAVQPRNALGQFMSKTPGQSAPGFNAVDDFVAHAQRNGYEVVNREVTFDTPFGQRRYDVVLRDPATLRTSGVEIKSSEAAMNRFDQAARQQFAADRWINMQGGATSVGGKGGITIESTYKIQW